MCQFIPTYDDQYFAAPSDLAYRYPRIVHLMLDKSQLNEKTKRSIIDDPKNEENENKLRNLGCKQVDTSEIVRILCERAHLHIEDDKYRTALYRYLAETPELRPYSQQLRSAKIIPIKGKYSPQEISYVSFNEMSIFVDETAAVSTPEYGILNTKILPKNTLERILGVDIVVIDSRYKKSLYDDKLEGILTSTATNAEKYRQLISELKCSRSQFNASLGVLLQNKNRVPLLTEDGEYHTEDVFITTLESGYFYGKEQSVNSSEIRENTIKRYRPASNTDGCFCQMCRTVKSTEYIEVNRSVPRSRCHRRTDGADSRPPPLHSSWCRPGHTSCPGQTAPGAPEAPPPSACWTPPPSACWTPAPHRPYSPSASPYTAGPQAGEINAFSSSFTFLF